MATFTEEMQGFSTFFNIFAMGHYTKNTIQNSLIKVYSIAFILAISIATIGIRFYDSVTEEISIHNLVGVIFLYSLRVSQLVILIQSYAWRVRRRELFDRFSEVDKMFTQRLDCPPSYSEERKSGWIRLIFIVSTFSVLSLDFYIRLIVENMMTVYWTHCLIAEIIIRINTAQIMFFVCALENRLTSVNKILDSMVLCKNNYRQSELINRLLTVKKIYGNLYETSEWINQVFGWSLLVQVTHAYIEFTVNGYWVFLTIHTAESELRLTCRVVSLLGPPLFNFFIIAFYSSRCTKNVRNSSFDFILISANGRNQPLPNKQFALLL